MSTVTQHAPGTFCWPELASSDQAGAKKFYTALFGWTATDSPIGEGATYTMLALGDRAVGALHQMRAEDHPAGTPSHWFSYIAVADADATAAKVAGLGGTLLRQPFDVMDAGRMAIVLDPIGAIFGLWQAGKHAGAQVLGEPGALGWTQLNANHPDKAIPFYAGLFNWGARRDPTAGGGTYTTWSVGSVPAGGMMTMPPEAAGVPSHWLVYFAVANVDASAEKAKALGGKWMVPPTDIPGAGRIAVLQDPKGAAFAILTFVAP